MAASPALAIRALALSRIEQLPLPPKNRTTLAAICPKGMLYGLITPDRSALRSHDPHRRHPARRSETRRIARAFGVSFQTSTGKRWTKLFATVAVIGRVASFHAILYAYGRNLFAVRAAYFPQWLLRPQPAPQNTRARA